MKRRTRLYRDGLIFLGVLIVVFLGAVVRQVNLLLLFASILFCFVVFDWRLGRRMLLGLRVRRRAPVGATAGEPFLVSVELENTRRRLPSWGIVVEETVTPLSDFGESSFERFAPSQASDGKKRRLFSGKRGKVFRPICYFEEVRPQTVQSESWAGRLPRRGRYQLGPLTVSTRFPLGFFRSSITISESAAFFVAPKIGRLSHEWLMSLHEKAEEKSRRSSRVERFGEEMFGVRDWQPQDARKWIHQRASAKYRKLLVRQYQRQTVQTTALALDLYDPAQDIRLEAMENRERAVSFAATLLMELVKRNSAAAFGMTARFYDAFHSDSNPAESPFFCRVSPGTIRSAIMERLATATATSVDTTPELLSRLASAGENISQLVFVTTRPFSADLDGRFAAWRAESRFSALLGKMTVVDTSSPAFDEIFKLD